MVYKLNSVICHCPGLFYTKVYNSIRFPLYSIAFAKLYFHSNAY